MADSATTPDTASAAASGRSPRAALFIVFLVVVVDLLGFGIVLPLLPIFGKKYVSAVLPGSEQTWISGLVIGLLMASFSAMQFFFAPWWGRLSDRHGRRPILLIGLAGSVVFYTLFGYACTLPANTTSEAALALALLFITRIGAGIAGATIATAQAVVADCTPPERRKQGMALIGAAFGIGFTIGPLVGYAGLLWLPDNLGVVGWSAALMSLIALLLGIFLLRETRDFTSAPTPRRRHFDTESIRLVLGNPAVAPVVLVFFLSSLGFASFEVTLALLNKEAMQLPERENLLVFAYIGFVLMITQGAVYRPLARQLSEPTLMTIGIVFMGLGVLSLGLVCYAAIEQLADFAVLLPAQLISLTFSVFGFAFLTPSAQALISRRSDPARQGEVLGVNQSFAALARILGPLLGLTLYQATRTHLLPYLMGAALLLLMLPLMPRIRRGH
jgi:DHA1 family tetracycline resistance protein-like MFS transporter